MKRPLFTALALISLMVMLTGCYASSQAKSDSVQQEAQEKMRQEANAQVGMPGVSNFTEMKLMRQLYELRDQEISTYTYIPDLEGRLWHLCDSVGYGLPYGTQFSNPSKIVPYGNNTYAPNTSHVIPQSEPNGLFMPPTAEGTWVICGTAKELRPVYAEPKVIVSPFKLHAFGEYQEK